MARLVLRRSWQRVRRGGAVCRSGVEPLRIMGQQHAVVDSPTSETDRCTLALGADSGRCTLPLTPDSDTRMPQHGAAGGGFWQGLVALTSHRVRGVTEGFSAGLGPRPPPKPRGRARDCSTSPLSSGSGGGGMQQVVVGMLTKRGASFPWSWRRRGFHYDAPSRVLYYYEGAPPAPALEAPRASALPMMRAAHGALGHITVLSVVRDHKFGQRHGLLFVGECGRLLHTEADSWAEMARWIAETRSDEMRDETIMID